MNLLKKEFDVNNFTKSETASRLKIDNKPTHEHEAELRKLHTLFIEVQSRISTRAGKPIDININSGYRSPQLNAAIPGSSKTSQHSLGQAADTFAIGIPCEQYYQYVKALVKANVITTGQVIMEYGRSPESEQDDWVHISLPTPKHKNEFMIKKPDRPYVKDLS
jgi:hypothetical protein